MLDFTPTLLLWSRRLIHFNDGGIKRLDRDKIATCELAHREKRANVASINLYVIGSSTTAACNQAKEHQAGRQVRNRRENIMHYRYTMRCQETMQASVN